MLVMTHISTQSLEGLFFDELSKVRVIDPETNGQTQELKEDCKEFVDKISEFQQLVGNFMETVDALAKQVEYEKMKAVGTHNQLKSIAKMRESQKQQLQALIAEKKMQLERLRVEYESLQMVDKEQSDFIEDFGSI